MSHHQYITDNELVREFHVEFGIDIDELVTSERLLLRWKLIKEEWLEVNEAFLYYDKLEFFSREKLLKELCDLLYVIHGTAATFGWDIEEAFERVHNSNMSKLDDSGKPIVRDDGKILKSPNYYEPDLSDLV